MNNNTNNRNSNNSSTSSWLTGAAIGLAGALVGGAAYMLTRPNAEEHQDNRPASGSHTQQRQQPVTQSSSQRTSNDNQSMSSYLTDMLSRMNTTYSGSTAKEMSRAPENPVISNLNSLLSDIYVRYIKLNEFDLHYKVFNTIFQDLHKKMKQVDRYYRKYSSTVQFAGSHFDNLRIVKPDEFDMDIVIGLPLNIGTDPLNPDGSDIMIEAKSPGFVQLKMGVQYQRLPMRDNEEWLNNRAAYEWKDEHNYLLRSKFTDWFKSVVNKALNLFEMNIDSRPLYYVEGVPYIIDKSESGPAMTLLISNKSRNFKLDVDLVPCLKFPEDRWPISSSYRNIPPSCRKGYWMVVGKPNKAALCSQDRTRSWRIAMHNQERELMYHLYNLKQTIRLVKKLRDSQGMTKIASYYIKTLFYNEMEKLNDKDYWQKNSPATLFKFMVGKFYQALIDGKIPYYWNKHNNLIESVDRTTLSRYAAKLVPLMSLLEQPSQYKLVAKYLLTPQEFTDYNSKYLHI